jgi:hypothetical protein
MSKVVGLSMCVVALLVTLGVSNAEATVNVAVYCDANQDGLLDNNFEPFDTPLANVRITVRSADGTFFAEALSISTGYASLPMPGFGSFTFAIDPATIPNGATPIGAGYPDWGQLPPGGSISVVYDDAFVPFIYFLVDDEACRTPTSEAKCWMTAGGVKFDPIAGIPLATNGPRDSFGGNVYPGCNANTGNQGGQWNHVSHSNKLHFQGFQIEVVACGNVPGIPAGSESPVTPYNFIEFRGTGRLMGIKGNQAEYPNVQFFARVEDRGEPGNEKANKGQTLDTDRYFLRVFDANNTLLLTDVDGDENTIDPLTITGGNLQLHFNPCPEPEQQ